MKVVTATGLDLLLDNRAGELGHGQRQALELAMVLAVNPTVVLLDEPTAGLTHDERAAIGRALSDLAATHNLCIVLVEHDLDFVKEVSSRVVVLHQGKLVSDGTAAEVAESSLVREIYVAVGA
jgi:branched-chain amino acid transport system permease protein